MTEKREKLLISACLLGVPCRYDGGSKPCPAALALREKYELIPVCPEVFGGLPTPRPPCEIRDGRVTDVDGNDRTDAYRLGAEKALAEAKKYGVTKAVLKERSPSCGKGIVHDGTFSGGLTVGDGITAALFAENGITVIGESGIGTLL